MVKCTSWRSSVPKIGSWVQLGAPTRQDTHQKAQSGWNWRFWKGRPKVLSWTSGLCEETGLSQEANKFSWTGQILWLEIRPEAFRWPSEAPNSAESWSGDISQTYFQKTNNKFIAEPNVCSRVVCVPAWEPPWCTCSLQVCGNECTSMTVSTVSSVSCAASC